MTERENLAEAEQEVRYAVECGDEIAVDRDTLRTVLAEYDRRGAELEHERASFGRLAHLLDDRIVERDEALGLLRELVELCDIFGPGTEFEHSLCWRIERARPWVERANEEAS